MADENTQQIHEIQLTLVRIESRVDVLERDMAELKNSFDELRKKVEEKLDESPRRGRGLAYTGGGVIGGGALYALLQQILELISGGNSK